MWLLGYLAIGIGMPIVTVATAHHMDRHNNERPKEALGWLSPARFRELIQKGKCLMVVDCVLTDDGS